MTESMDMLRFAIKYARNERGMSQKELAAALEVSTVHMNRIEQGKDLPSFGVLARMNAIFGVDLYVLAWARFADRDAWSDELRRGANELLIPIDTALGRRGE